MHTLKTDNLQLYYEDIPALKGVTLELASGEIYGLQGPNGAGKSTLLKIAAGIITAYRGSIALDGHEVRKERFWIKQNSCYCAEQASLMPYLSGREYLTMIADMYNADKKVIGHYLELCNLAREADTLVEDYSHGMRQKLSLAGAFLPRPPFLFLDEALNGLDHDTTAIVLDYLAGQKETLVVLASHQPELLQRTCTTVLRIEDGKIV